MQQTEMHWNWAASFSESSLQVVYLNSTVMLVIQLILHFSHVNSWWKCWIDTEAVQRAATIAEAEGVSKIEATHLERILPQLLLDFWGI